MQRNMTVFLYYYRCCCQGYYDIRIICCRLGDWGPYLHVIVVISIHGLLFIKVAVAAAPRPPPPVGAIQNRLGSHSSASPDDDQGHLLGAIRRMLVLPMAVTYVDRGPWRKRQRCMWTNRLSVFHGISIPDKQMRGKGTGIGRPISHMERTIFHTRIIGRGETRGGNKETISIVNHDTRGEVVILCE